MSNYSGYYDKTKYQINLNKDSQPFKRSYCSVSLDKRKATKKSAKDIEDAELIERARSYWAAPSILVRKKDGSYRLL